MLVNDFINDAVLASLLGTHPKIALHIALNLLYRLVRMLGHYFIKAGANTQDFAGVDVDVRFLPRETAYGRLVNKQARIGECKTLPRTSRRQQHRRHAGRLANADGGNVRADEL